MSASVMIAEMSRPLTRFLIDEFERERVDVIIYDSVAMWGYVAARTHDIPQISFITTFVLDGSQKAIGRGELARFFVAALPESQAARDVSGEADQVVWVRPEEALATAARGEVALLPPTWSVLTELAAFASVSAVLDAAAHRALDMAMPGWVDDGDAVRLLLPGDPGFPGDDEGRR